MNEFIGPHKRIPDVRLYRLIRGYNPSTVSGLVRLNSDIREIKKYWPRENINQCFKVLVK